MENTENKQVNLRDFITLRISSESYQLIEESKMILFKQHPKKYLRDEILKTALKYYVDNHKVSEA